LDIISNSNIFYWGRALKTREKYQNNIEYFMKLPYSLLLHQIEDEGKQYWIAEIPELPGCKSHGETIGEAVASIEEAKKDWVLDSLEDGEEIPTPIEREKFSGRTLLRMSRSLHRALSLIAETEKLSLNQLIVTILAKEVGRLGVLNRVEEKLDSLLVKLEKNMEQTEQTLILSSATQCRLCENAYHQYSREALTSTGLQRRHMHISGANVHIGAAIPAFTGTTPNLGNTWGYNAVDLENTSIFEFFPPDSIETINDTNIVTVAEK
jgi:antitoxin HicB